jgi:transcriptional regulator with XRE-family HTH domain
MKVRELGGFIRDQRRNARLSLRKLSRMAGVSNPYLSQIERGLRRPSADILQAIAKALRISAETLYVKAGILDERGTDVDLAAQILRDPTITEKQKQVLISVYESFRDGKPVRQIPKPTRATRKPAGQARRASRAKTARRTQRRVGGARA